MLLLHSELNKLIDLGQLHVHQVLKLKKVAQSLWQYMIHGDILRDYWESKFDLRNIVRPSQ